MTGTSHLMVVVVVLAVAAAAVAAVALALIKGGPKQPKPVASINDPFRSVDLSGLPAIQYVQARDNTALAYRFYPSRVAQTRGSAVLIHGSSASGKSLHSLAMRLAEAGYASYTLDMRGHGESGARGTIAYIGQLEDDLEDCLAALDPATPRTLIGFSAGGGFALRFAADRRKNAFARYVLLSPFLHHRSPTTRPAAGGWAHVGMPRIVVLVTLNAVRIKVFNHLRTIAYALTPEAQKMLTPQYSFNLMQNFRPNADYRADIRHATQPMHVLIGSDDEAFFADAFAAEFTKPSTNVTIVEGVGHIGLTLAPEALDAIVASLDATPFAHRTG
ncbi:alpha/beta fold hydrolase [Paraburkholderia sp.]|uniref:alpha/beta hydrolase n=1 Tax=Paraburkholderia sp. TaxID=1926495 RepID=UPI0023837CB0|nr:alpha/beta fold hydrolase [Paraburkholderia sp.]MDE1180537.1 alpha/beta fold hydrolase [Paraburkholderia sp.]